MMRAIRIQRYGKPEVLEEMQVERPSAGPGQILVKVAFAGVNPKDCMVRKGRFQFLTGRKFPISLGHDIAGTVEDVGRGASGFQKGDQVYGMINSWTGAGYAEYAAVSADAFAHIPMNLSLKEAASMPLAAQTALQALRDHAKLFEGQRILLNGASGGVGTFAIQIARAYGAHVTTTSSKRNLELCSQLGAHEAIDYAEKPVSELKERFDAVFDVFGNYQFASARHLLGNGGRYIHTIPSARIAKDYLRTRLQGERASLVIVQSSQRNLDALARLVDSGRLMPVIDREFDLSDVIDAHHYIETKRARGKVVLKVA